MPSDMLARRIALAQDYAHAVAFESDDPPLEVELAVAADWALIRVRGRHWPGSRFPSVAERVALADVAAAAMTDPNPLLDAIDRAAARYRAQAVAA